jgi:outer membrane protein OmpA-like peptidoglycan-associated protein
MKQTAIKGNGAGCTPGVTRSLTTATLILLIAFLAAPQQVKAQVDAHTAPSWWFGGAVGGNINFYRGSTYKLSNALTPPVVFNDGLGLGVYAAPTVSYYKPNGLLGFMFQFGYDSRKGAFSEQVTDCDCPANLSTNLNYLVIEPSLRFAPFRSSLYLYAGPRLAFNWSHSYTYQLEVNPAFPTQEPTAAVKGDFSDISSPILSMQFGAGIDIPLTASEKRTQWVLAPFVAVHPYFGQNPRSIETWNITTVRVGAALKFGTGSSVIERVNKEKVNEEKKLVPMVAPNNVRLAVFAPANIPVERRANETFPLRNYVFFDLESTKIPKRYVVLNKTEVQDFKTEQLEVLEPKRETGRSNRQLNVYYNVLNILGDRMQENPNTKIRLVGSSEKGAADGKEMAESVKTYLIEVWSIDPERMTTNGGTKPLVPSEQVGGTLDLVRLREGDRRVTIETSSPELLMEFRSGNDAPLKPVVLSVVQAAPAESFVSFSVTDPDKQLKTWSFEVKDDQGAVQQYGPYTQTTVTVPGKTLMGTRLKGRFLITMTGVRKVGPDVIADTSVQMVQWTPDVYEKVNRYSVIYEFNNSKSIQAYDDYLSKVVVKKIPANGRVFINGYSDNIGEAEYNRMLSLERAQDVQRIMKKALKAEGRNDVTFMVEGHGEESGAMPFDNKYPEERFYNRTVFIDILPGK